jgi:hypothetical protein
MDMMDKVKMDAELREKARALHQDLYRIKMKALRNAKKLYAAQCVRACVYERERGVLFGVKPHSI